MARTKKVVTKTEGKYEVTVKSVDGIQLNREVTDNLVETIGRFKPESITGKVFVRVDTKDKSIERLLFAPQARKLFSNPMSLSIFARNIERALI